MPSLYRFLQVVTLLSICIVYWIEVHPWVTGNDQSTSTGIALGVMTTYFMLLIRSRQRKEAGPFSPTELKMIGVAGASFFFGWFANYPGPIDGVALLMAAGLIGVPLLLLAHGLRLEAESRSRSSSPSP